MSNQAADTKYIELEKKINIARTLEYTISDATNSLKINPYFHARQEIVEKYFQRPYQSENTKRHLLDVFSQYNEAISTILGL